MPHELWVDIPGFSGSGGTFAGFTTRRGGVSPHPFDSLNFSFYRDDSSENVLANHRILASALGTDVVRLVRAHQVHGAVCLRVDGRDGGISPATPDRLEGVDALITDEPGLVLLTTHADCVPLFFRDGVRRSVGLAHAGWAGTLAGVAGSTVAAMRDAFGTDPSDLEVVIGPHIGPCCFEIGVDLLERFRAHTAWTEETATTAAAGGAHVSLGMLLRRELVGLGLSDRRIADMRTCTRCESDRYFSHRGSGGNTGCGAAFLGLEAAGR